MASDTEDTICWQCSEYATIFPELMCCINNLKQKKRKTDKDSIVEVIISNGNTEITEENKIDDILTYATMTSYITQSTYNQHYTYKINNEITEAKQCSSCGESITSFDCVAFEVNPEIKYVDLGTFQALAGEIIYMV